MKMAARVSPSPRWLSLSKPGTRHLILDTFPLRLTRGIWRLGRV